jgi:hypothetical protein
MKSARSDTPGFRLPGINKAGLQAGSLLSRSRGLTPSTPETTAKTEKSKAQLCPNNSNRGAVCRRLQFTLNRPAFRILRNMPPTTTTLISTIGNVIASMSHSGIFKEEVIKC